MDLKLCSDVPTVNFVDTWTFVIAPYLPPGTWSPNIWDLANGCKLICQPLGDLLGPVSRVLGPVPRFNLVFMHHDFWDPDPGTRDPDCRLAPNMRYFLTKMTVIVIPDLILNSK